MWWLILCINLRELRDAKVAGKTLFLNVSKRVPLKEISTQIIEMSKVNFPQCVGIIKFAEILNRTKHCGGRANLLSVLSWNIHLLSLDTGTSSLGPLD